MVAVVVLKRAELYAGAGAGAGASARLQVCVFSGACFRVRVFVCESVVSLICNTTIIRISKTS